MLISHSSVVIEFFLPHTQTMADACFTACATTGKHVRSSIAKLTLLTNASDQYKHKHATTVAGIRRILCKTYNPATLTTEWTNSA
jgi:hypothetical protein